MSDILASMAARYVSVEKYLKTVYRPDREYVDGVVRERLWGERDHALVQSSLIAFFGSRYRVTGLVVIPSLRFQTAPSCLRVPDIVITRGKPNEQILTKPPLLCIEILSPRDRMRSMTTKTKEYLDFGVPVVWLIEPTERRIWIYRANGMQEAAGESIKLDGTDIEVPFSEIFD